MKLAVVFPGQGSQAVGMGVDAAARWPQAARRYEEAAEILGYDLRALCAQGPEDRLSDTGAAQPALYVAGYATWEGLSAAGLAPTFVAGHSLGEYTACAAARVFSFSDGLRAVKVRGQAMQEAATRHPGGMAAVMGAKTDDVERWVNEAMAHGPVLIANWNAPGQVIVSGAGPALETVQRLGKAAGARVIPLKVSGAFHSPLMREAGERMKQFLAGLTLADPEVPVVGNVGGSVLSSAQQVREELEAQLTSPVKWEACVHTLRRNGVDRIVECGPGRVLSGLIRKIDKSLATFCTGSAKELDDILAEMNGVVSGAA